MDMLNADWLVVEAFSSGSNASQGLLFNRPFCKSFKHLSAVCNSME